MNRRSLLVTSLVLTTTLALTAADVLSQLGVDDSQAGQMFLSGITSGHPWVVGAKAFKAAAPAAQSAIVSGVVGWARVYSRSEDFKSAYATERENTKPEAPQATGSADEEIKKRKAELDAQVAEALKGAASLPAEQRKEIEKAIRDAAAASEEFNRDPEMQKAQRESIELQRKSEQEEYAKAMTAWETNYPPDPSRLIARRLREFLATSATVDFNAKLVPAGRKMKFADPKYEAMPTEWKMCYRAGKDAVTAAREAAQKWLAELV